MQLTHVIEALLIASEEPLSVKEITDTLRAASRAAESPDSPCKEFKRIKADEVEEALHDLEKSLSRSKRAFTISERHTGWKIYTKPEFGEWVRELFPDKRPRRLSPSALETLAIIAYRQPVTKADIEAVRGVSSDGVLHGLMERHLVHIDGRADLPGRPMLYATTDNFLEHFGIREIDELPDAEELRRVKLPTAEPEVETEAESADAADEPDSTSEGGAEAKEAEAKSEEPEPQSEPSEV